VREAFVFIVIGFATSSCPGAACAGSVAGLAPSARPVNTPAITVFAKDDAWYAHALLGVEPPYPDSLGFLRDQGAWFNPFIHPGMIGPYDLRGWHRPEPDSSQN
jgi:hypothetical protein